jgi:hypothetical protein
MMSLVVLDSVVRYGTAEVVPSLGRDKASTILSDFAALVPEVAGGVAGFVIRFGSAAPPTTRTGRLPLSAVVQSAAVASNTFS